VLEELKEVE